MKKIIFGILLLAGMISCNEDLGNYDYIEVEKVVLETFEADGYTLLRGKELEIALGFNLPEGRDTADFNYLWIINSEDRVSSQLIKDTLSLEPQLKKLISLPVGAYALQLQIIDPRTNLVWSERTSLRVTGSAEGWLFLEKDQAGMAELSMYAKDNVDGSYLYIPSMLESAGVPLDLRKGPRSLVNILKKTVTRGGYGVWIMTDNGVFMLDTDNAHAYDKANQPANYMITDFGVKPERIFSTNANSPNVFMFAEGKMYSSTSLTQVSFGLDMSSTLGYDLAPLVGSCPNNFMGNNMFFERSQKKFVQYNSFAASFFDVWGTPIGDELLHMDYRAADLNDPNPMNINTPVYALMKSLTGTKAPIGEKYLLTWKLGFMGSTITLGGSQVLSKATHLVDDSKMVLPQQINLPYLYYSDANEQLYMTTGNAEHEIIVSGGKLEGKIVSLTTRFFFNTYPVDQFQEYIDFEKMIIVSTEKDDGSGEVYFLSIPNSGKAHELKLEDSVKTNAPVISVDFQEKAAIA